MHKRLRISALCIKLYSASDHRLDLAQTLVGQQSSMSTFGCAKFAFGGIMAEFSGFSGHSHP